jgi:phosphohistidine phosphatase
VTRTLAVLRHAKSAWPDGVADLARPLADRGRRDAPVAGRWLREHVAGIEAVVCSPAARTQQTWELVAAELGGPPSFRLDRRIYDATVHSLLAVVRGLPAEAGTALLIGHDPGLSALVFELSGTEFPMKTSSVALLRGQGDWLDAGPEWARLERVETPRGSADRN